jgi:hypothetical protein
MVFRIPDDGQSPKTQVILSIIHHGQNTIESKWTVNFVFIHAYVLNQATAPANLSKPGGWPLLSIAIGDCGGQELQRNFILQLEHWGRGFESNKMHDVPSSFLSCVVTGLAMGRSPVQGVLPVVYLIHDFKINSDLELTKGCNPYRLNKKTKKNKTRILEKCRSFRVVILNLWFVNPIWDVKCVHKFAGGFLVCGNV